MTSAKGWIFNLYFNYKDEESRRLAEIKRDERLIYMRHTMERIARFSAIAKDEHKANSCLILSGYMALKYPCTKAHIKKILGKYSNCTPSVYGCLVNLLKYFSIDKYLTVTGRLPSQGDCKTALDARSVMRMVHGSDEKKDELVSH